jgi:hypothetical protein
MASGNEQFSTMQIANGALFAHAVAGMDVGASMRGGFNLRWVSFHNSIEGRSASSNADTESVLGHR